MSKTARGVAPAALSLQLFLLLPLLALAGLYGCSRSGSDVKIGVMVLGSRTTRTPTNDRVAGARLAAEELNKAGGGAVRMVVTRIGGNPANAVKAFRTLVEKHHVQAVIAALTSGEVLACAPLANQTRTVLLTTLGTSADIRFAGDYVFRNVASVAAGADLLARAIGTSHRGARIAIVHPDLEFGISYRDRLIAGLTELGEPIPQSVSYTLRTTDLTPIVTALQAANPQVVFVVGSENGFGPILHKLQEAGIKAEYALGGDISEAAIRAIGPPAEGALAAVDRFSVHSEDPRTQTFVHDFRARFHLDPSYQAGAMYDALHLLATQIRQGAKTGEGLRDALYAARNLPSVAGGEISFDPDGELRSGARLTVVRGGELVPLQ